MAKQYGVAFETSQIREQGSRLWCRLAIDWRTARAVRTARFARER